MNSNVEFSLRLLDEFFSKHNCNFWLEAGTALAAYRDGEVFPWEHDIDIAIWRDDLPNSDSIIKFFTSYGYDVIIQKNFPYIDNIIQLKVKDQTKFDIFDIDIYLYTRLDGYAYMRWIQKPEGGFSFVKILILDILKNLINPVNQKWKMRAKIFPRRMVKQIYFIYLKYHIQNSKCIYHRFPESFFLNFRYLKFYDIEVRVPLDIEKFLEYRYGPNWRKPDEQFNQTGKWRASSARVMLEMKLLPVPNFDTRIAQ